MVTLLIPENLMPEESSSRQEKGERRTGYLRRKYIAVSCPILAWRRIGFVRLVNEAITTSWGA